MTTIRLLGKRIGLTVLLLGCIVLASPLAAQTATPVSTPDARLNNGTDLVIYCAAGGGVLGLNVLRNTGVFAFQVNMAQISAGLVAARQQRRNTQIVSGVLGAGLWALSSGELQATIRYPGRQEYNFIFPSDRCGQVNWNATPLAAIITQRTPTPVPGQTTSPGGATTIYIVQRGDNLYRIALRFRTTISAIAAANQIANLNLIYAGMRLTIPAPGVAPIPPTPTHAPTPLPTATPAVCASPYIVQRGDNLYRIALRCGRTMAAIAAANGITNFNLIYVGQRLILP